MVGRGGRQENDNTEDRDIVFHFSSSEECSEEVHIQN